MTSGVFRTCPIDQIIVNRDERQRKDISDVSELVDSIRRLGLIHPPVVTRDFVLVVGERRIAALKELGWDTVPFQFQDEMDEVTLCGIELEENIKRKNLPWQDEMSAIDRFHDLRRAKDLSWTQEKTGAAIGLDRRSATNRLTVADALRNPDIKPEKRLEIRQANTLAEALRAVKVEEHIQRAARKEARERLHLGMDDANDWHQPYQILHIRFEDWLTSYDGPRFNLIHCDFPYGIGFNRMGSQAGSAYGRYSDTPADYRDLLETFCTTLDIFAEDSCHFIFWFSMQNYQLTYDFLTEERTSIALDPFPFIWLKSDNTGIVPDALRGPRRVYETAFFGRRGDRPVISPRANAIAYPSNGQIHPHEKPQTMLEHFFSMFVNEHTTLFDPTCGSGSSLRAARSLGAQRVLGLEADERFAQLANFEFGRQGHQ
jgi:ParB-like chromosome segregation protein Spo0J